MCDATNNIQHTWQLVSQFVSWEFCRYVCEQNIRSTSDVDVFVLLRNMIVQRTDKTISEVTKHEIIAKFLMELKAVDETRLSCIIALSDSVIKICPELEVAVRKLMHHLTTFLRVLSCNEECLKEDLIKERIEGAIYDFSKECKKLLPQPDLLQIIESWNHHHSHNHPKPSKKVSYNAQLLVKVLECLHLEGITPSEAKLIAVSLHEDKYFEKILRNAEAETETEVDSELFSMQSSQPTDLRFSQEFQKNVMQEISDSAPMPNNVNQDSLHLDTFSEPNEIRNDFPICVAPKPASNEDLPDSSNIEAPEEPPEMAHVPLSSPLHLQTHTDEADSPERRNSGLASNENQSALQFAQSSARESDSDPFETSLHSRINSKLTSMMNEKNKVVSNDDSPDTSDCEQNPEFRFLTPTLFKQGVNTEAAPKTQNIVWLSDSESNGSSINTTLGIGSQKTDPNWTKNMSLKHVFFPQKKHKNIPKKKAIVLSETEDEEPVNSNINADRVEATVERPTKRRRLEKTVNLYRSPNLSIADFHLVRRPIHNSPRNKSGKTAASSGVSSNIPIVPTNVSTDSPSISLNNTSNKQNSSTSKTVGVRPFFVPSKNLPKRPVSIAVSDPPVHRATNTRSSKPHLAEQN